MGGSGGLVLAGTGYLGGAGGYGPGAAYGGGGGGSGGPSGAGSQGGNGTGGGNGGGSGGTGYASGGIGGFDGSGGNGGFPGGGGAGSGNNSGGNGGNGEIIIAYTQQAVPEPGTLALLGAVGLAAYAWKRKRGLRRVLCVGIVMALGGVGNVWGQSHYRVTDLGTLSGGSMSEATAINSHGQIVGASSNSNSESQAFVYSGSSMQSLGMLSPSQSWSWANSINNAGQIVGVSQQSTVVARNTLSLIAAGQ